MTLGNDLGLRPSYQMMEFVLTLRTISIDWLSRSNTNSLEYIRFIGIHAEYDKINAETISEKVLNIRPIHTEEDYKRVMDRIDELIDAEQNTLEFDELEVLSILAESYEVEYHEIPSPNPIETLNNIMEWKE